MVELSINAKIMMILELNAKTLLLDLSVGAVKATLLYHHRCSVKILMSACIHRVLPTGLVKTTWGATHVLANLVIQEMEKLVLIWTNVQIQV
jgi:hypothetical protein